jgi:hypothetical protein
MCHALASVSIVPTLSWSGFSAVALIALQVNHKVFPQQFVFLAGRQRENFVPRVAINE